MRHRAVQGFVLLALWLSIEAAPVAAAPASPALERAAPATVVVADGAVGSFVTGGGRARVVQVCAVVMCIALFIMMRKLR